MENKIRVLIVEDSAADAELVVRALGQEGFAHTAKRVESKEAFRKALQEFAPDIVLCDYKLPGFGAPEALEMLKKEGLKIPFIVVSGTIGEEVAVEMLKAGTTDYLMKDKLSKLGSAIKRAMEEVRERAERKEAEEALRESEDSLQFALDAAKIGAWDLDLKDHSISRTVGHDHIFGYDTVLPQWTYEMFLEHVLPEDRAEVDREFQKAVSARDELSFECRVRHTDGEIRWILVAGRHTEKVSGRAQHITGIVQDITERKAVEEALKKLANAKSRFTLMVSHEFRSPLAVIKGAVALVAEEIIGSINDEQRDILCNSSARGSAPSTSSHTRSD